jgi:phosphoserine phosphatase RsbU/P
MTLISAPRRPAPQTDGGRILVVDDNEMNRDMLSRRLRRQGFEAEVAEDGRQALAMLAAEAFDVVLLDIMMPEMNGYEVLEYLKAHETLQHVPVIMITALDDPDSVVRCIQMGAEDYLPKPFNPTLLRARIDSSLAKKRLRDREQLHAQSLEREMEIGRRIQAGFLPQTLPRIQGWEIAATFRPARQVAGDFYDVFEAGDDCGVGLVVADVCDKGVGAALFMALFRTLIRSSAERCTTDGAPAANGDRPTAGDRAALLSHTVTTVNDYIARNHGSANMFATVFFGLLDSNTGSLLYINGGHDPPVVARRDGRQERLPPTGPAVGMLPGLPFDISETRIEPGDLLLAFTDGVSDARGADDSLFSEERLLSLLRPSETDPAALLTRIEDALLAHTDGTDAFDDVTLLAVGRND